MKRVVLVIGATGMTGRYFLQYADRSAALEAIGVSRRAPDYPTDARFISIDLSNADEAHSRLSGLPDVTDVVYAGFVPAPTWQEQVAPNVAMLVNTVRGIEAAGGNLQRILLVQGMKYYGNHLGPFRTPAREDDPRHMPPNYYYEQQDFLEQESQGKSWSYTCIRPHVICGYGLGSTQNLLMVVGVYAAMCKELGVPLRFPGTPAAFRAINQATDADLLARSIGWALFEPACADQAFNITNGDFFRWVHLWPRIADLFGIPAGDAATLDLATQMADKGPVWNRIVEQHKLQPTNMEDLVHWPFADYILRTEWDVMASTIKARHFGFQDCLDTEEMFLNLLREFQKQRVLPG